MGSNTPVRSGNLSTKPLVVSLLEGYRVGCSTVTPAALTRSVDSPELVARRAWVSMLSRFRTVKSDTKYDSLPDRSRGRRAESCSSWRPDG